VGLIESFSLQKGKPMASDRTSSMPLDPMAEAIRHGIVLESIVTTLAARAGIGDQELEEIRRQAQRKFDNTHGNTKKMTPR
jgi:hypothetical protein